MRYFLLFLPGLIFCTLSNAQPVRSPKARADADARWMHDSLHLSSQQFSKVQPVLLNYQQQMDESSNDAKKQSTLMAKKDADIKPILNRWQYKVYYRREEQIRALPKRDPGARHQPY